MNLNNFIEDLASSRPTPGGGAAAAMAGAMAAALVEMVAAMPPQSAKCQVLGAKLRKRLMELADEDCRAFDAVMTAYKKKSGMREALEWAMR
ncbi:MAG: cyclodeaminase/cyclohydrolase family protein, partial [Patescibacteria group bacterium]